MQNIALAMSEMKYNFPINFSGRRQGVCGIFIFLKWFCLNVFVIELNMYDL